MDITSKMLDYNNYRFSMTNAARMIDRGIGRNKLCKLLRENGVLDYRNRPLEPYIDAGYFDYDQPREIAEDGLVDLPYSVPYMKPRGIR